MLITTPLYPGGDGRSLFCGSGGDGILDMAGSHRGGMETLSDLKIDRFRELFALLDLKKSKSCNRLIYIFHVSKSTGVVPIACFAAQGGDGNLEATLLSRGGMPRAHFTLNHPRGD